MFRLSSSVALSAGFAAALHLALPATARAEAPADVDLTIAGSYLAARFASSERDSDAAVTYLRNLLKLDSRNEDVVERAFFATLADGQVDEAMKLADRLVKVDRSHRIARLALAVKAIKKSQYQTARTNLSLSVRGPIGDLTATLLAAWTFYGSGNAKGAVELIDRLQGPDWYAPLKALHSGLILDASGNKKDAGKRLLDAVKLDPGSLRTVEAYARWLSRNDGPAAAIAAYADFEKAMPNNPVVATALKELNAGKALPPLVSTAQQGSAEVLYGLGSTLGRQGGEDLALVYLQLASWLDPDHPFTAITLADLYEQLQQPQKAIETYELVAAGSPLKRNAEVKEAINLDSIDKPDEAKKKLAALIAADPKDVEAIMALGRIQQSRKQFAECATTYSRAIDLTGEPSKSNWPLFYFRGICSERSKNWPAAEADLKKALALNPDQPNVLNYLGYSWVDQGVNLDEGLDMIRKAVALRPDDGHIVDSLGWAYYRMGRYEDAVTELERAIELMPQDPVVNDHLGDAYWKVGRRLEAGFQWAHARDMKPDPEDLEKIVKKIDKGLDAVDQPAPVRKAEDQKGG